MKQRYSGNIEKPKTAADNSGRRNQGFELDEDKKKAFDMALNRLRQDNGYEANRIATGMNQRSKSIYDRLISNTYMSKEERRQLSNELLSYNADLKRLKFYGYDVDGMLEAGKQLDDVMSRKSRVYGQYASEIDYNRDVLSGGVYEDGSEARGEVYQRNKARMSELEKILKNGENSAAQEELEALRTMNAAYERGTKVTDDYLKNTKESDFARRSKQRDYGNPTQEYAEEYRRRFDRNTIAYDPVAGGLINELGELVNEDLYAKYAEPVVNDKLGAYLSGDPEHSRLQKTNGAANALDEAVAEGDELGWQYLTEDEIGIYYYLYSKNGKDAAEKYLEDMQVTLSRRAEKDFQGSVEAAGNWRLALFNAASVPMNVVGGAAEGINYLTQQAAGNMDDYNPYNSFTRQAGIIRGETAERIDNATGNADLFGFSLGDAYQAMMSGADSALGAAIGGHAYTAFMGMSAASAEATRLWEMGASQNQILAGSLTAGAAETVFEYISLDHFLKLDSPETMKNVVFNILAQGGVEASEEIATEISNTITNTLIMGSQSDLQKGIKELEAQGYTEAQAAALYIGQNLWESGMGGFVSGAAMAAPSSVAGYTGNQAYYRAEGRDIQSVDGAQTLKDLANQVVAEKIANQDRAGKKDQAALQKAIDRAERKDNSRNIGYLSHRVDESRQAQNRQDLKNALKKDAGMTEKKAAAAAEIISAVKELSADEETMKGYRALTENKKVSSVIDTIYGETGQITDRNTRHLAGRMGLELAEDSAEVQNQYSVSDTGEAFLRSDGENIQSMEAVEKNGTTMMKVKTEKGTQYVTPSEVSFASEDQAVMVQKFEDMGIAPESIAPLMQAYTDSTQDLGAYVLGVQEAYTYGRHSMDMSRGAFVKDLTEYQRRYAYNRGQIDEGRAVAAAEARIRAAVKNGKKAKKGELVYDYDRSTQEMSNLQKQSAFALEKLAKTLGINIHLYKSTQTADGSFVIEDKDGRQKPADNGYYKNGEIYIDVNAGMDGKGALLFTAAHEMTHMIRQWSPAKFKTLANFLVKQYDENGKPVEELVRLQQQKAADNGRSISFDEAFEEMVADSMESVLQDGRCMEMMAELKTRDHKLWSKIRNWWAELAAKIRKLYAGLNPESAEGRMVKEMADAAEKIRKMFAEGVVEASDNLSVAYDSKGRAAAAMDQGQASFSLRTYEDSGRKILMDYLEQRVKEGKLEESERAEMQSQMDVLYSICKKYAGKFAQFGAWSNAEIVERNGKPVFSVVKKNGEYALNLDFSLVCKKRRTLDAVFNEMIKTGLMDQIDTLAETDIARINQIIREYDFETACALCFVDAKRYRQGMVADSFSNLYNHLVNSMAPDGVSPAFFNFGGNSTVKASGGIHNMDDSLLNFDEIDRTMQVYKHGSVEYKAAKLLKENPAQRKLVLRGDFMSSSGMGAVKTENPALLKLYNSKKGTGGPKASESDVQYLSEIISRKAFNAKKAYSVGGVRIQSFSDYVPRMIFDYIQMTADLAAKELPAHAYTKEAIYALHFGKTGIKINLSLVPDVAADGVAPGLDKDGNYLWRDGQSFGSDVSVKGSGQTGYQLALKIQNAEGYDANCGTIAVGISNEQILKLLRDPNIRMVIPYHKSSLNHLVAAMNSIGAFTDYTIYQNTRLNGGKLPKGVKDFNFNLALQTYGDAKKAANAYLNWCDEHGYTPKFDMFRAEDNYYKLLEDFNTYDAAGNPAPQGAVKLIFPGDGDTFGSMADLIKSGLEEDAVLQGRQDNAVPKIVEDIRMVFEQEGRVNKTEAEKRSERFSAASSTRGMLGNLDASTVKNDIERKHLTEYQQTQRKLAQEQEQAQVLREDLQELRSGKGKRSVGSVRTLEAELSKTENRMNVLSGKMMRMEDSTPLKRIVEREQKAAERENIRAMQESLTAQKEKLKEETREQLKALREELTEKKKKAVSEAKKKEHEKSNLRVEKLKETTKTKKTMAEMKEKIRKLTKNLQSRLDHPKEGKYVPRELVSATVDILNAINMDSGRSEKLTEKLAMLKLRYEAMKNQPEYAMAYDSFYEDLLSGMVKQIGNTSVSQMSVEQLETVHDVLKALHEGIRTANKVTIQGEERDAYQTAMELIKETGAAAGGDGIIARWKNASLRPETMFERLAGFKKNSTWSKLYRLLDDGQLKSTRIIMEGSRIFDDVISDTKQLENLRNMVDIGLKDENDNSVEITRGMMLSIAMHMANEQNRNHIIYGGLTVPDLRNYYKGKTGDSFGIGHVTVHGYSSEIGRLQHELSHAETEEQAEAIKEEIDGIREKAEAFGDTISKAIEETLTDYEKHWLAKAREFFDRFSKAYLNEATMEMYHFQKAKVDGYYPIHTDPNYRDASFESIVKDMSLENSGFMKDRVQGAKNPILLEDIADVVNSQLKRTAAYCGLAPAIRTFQKVYSKSQRGYVGSVQDTIASKFGKEGKNWVENLLADLTGSRHTQTTVFDKLRGNMAAATLTLNPRVAMVQAASYPTAAAELGYGPLLKALRRGGRNGRVISRADQDLIMKYSPLLWYRMQGYSNVELGDIRSSQEMMGKVNRKLRWAMGWIQAADGATVGRLWYAAQYYVDDHYSHLEQGTEAYYEKVAEVFNRVVEKTQPNYTVMQRPDILRNPNAILRQLTMFMTQRLQNYGIMYEAVARYNKYKQDFKAGINEVTQADISEARNTAIRSISSQIAANLTIVAFKALADLLTHSFNGYRDDEEEITGKSVSLALLDSFANSLVSSFLWGSEIYSAVSAAVTGREYDGLTVNAIDSLTNAINSLLNLANKIKDPDKSLSVKDFSKIGFAITNAIGIPANNAYKITRGLYYNFAGIATGNFADIGEDRTAGQNGELLYQAMLAGDKERISKFSGTFEDDRALHKAIRDQLVEKDDRIRRAAEARLAGNVQEYTRLVKEIKAEGIFIQDDIVASVNTVINRLSKDKSDTPKEHSSPSMYKQGDYLLAIEAGQMETAKEIRTTMISGYVKDGKSQTEAEKAFYSSVRTSIKDAFEEGRYSADKAASALERYGGLTQEEAASRAGKWEFDRDYPGYDWTERQIETFKESVKPSGISVEIFDRYLTEYAQISGDGKREMVAEMIHGLPITSQQKDMLYLLTYKEKYLYKTPWH